MHSRTVAKALPGEDAGNANKRAKYRYVGRFLRRPMKAIMVASSAVLLLVCDAGAQLRLEVKNTGTGTPTRHSVMWAKGCNGRIEVFDRKDADMFMVVRDCGKTLISVS